MGIKLYYGGFGNYMEYVVAENEQDAITKLGIKINAPFLPITASEIQNIDGYQICVRAWDASTVTTLDEKPIEAEEVEIKTENSLRHCKKCDFTCETQGQLLAHYREFHSKGD